MKKGELFKNFLCRVSQCVTKIQGALIAPFRESYRALIQDGVIESRNQAGKEFGRERLAAYLGKRNTLALKEIIDGLMTEIRAFTSGMPQEDDITMLALRYR